MSESKIESLIAFIFRSRKVAASLSESHLVPPQVSHPREHISTADVSRHSQDVLVAPDVEELSPDKEKEVVGTNGEEDLVPSSVHGLIVFAVDLLVESAGMHIWNDSACSHFARRDCSLARTCCTAQMQQSWF
jgi:hypothetical protein